MEGLGTWIKVLQLEHSKDIRRLRRRRLPSLKSMNAVDVIEDGRSA